MVEIRIQGIQFEGVQWAWAGSGVGQGYSHRSQVFSIVAEGLAMTGQQRRQSNTYGEEKKFTTCH